MKPEDHLMEQLLQRQSNNADEDLLRNIEQALDTDEFPQQKQSNVGWLSAIAALVIVAIGIMAMSLWNAKSTQQTVKEEKEQDSSLFTIHLPPEAKNGRNAKDEFFQRERINFPPEQQKLLDSFIGIANHEITYPKIEIVNSDDFRYSLTEGEFTALSQDVQSLKAEWSESFAKSNWKSPMETPVSNTPVATTYTSYEQLRDRIQGSWISNPKNVRIEEMVNAFSYQYKKPQKELFEISTSLSECPWNEKHFLARITVQGKALEGDTDLSALVEEAKSQVEFNPRKVRAYRLIGYDQENLAKTKEPDSSKGVPYNHSHTLFYELVFGKPKDAYASYSDQQQGKNLTEEDFIHAQDWFTVTLKYKQFGEAGWTEMTHRDASTPVAFDLTDFDFQFAAGVAAIGMKWRGYESIQNYNWETIYDLLSESIENTSDKTRIEFLKLIQLIER